MRFFRVTPAEYEATRLAADAILGNPTPDGRTVTCVEPLGESLRDRDGNVMAALYEDMLSDQPLSSLFRGLMASGAAVEIGWDEYGAALPRWTGGAA